MLIMKYIHPSSRFITIVTAKRMIVTIKQIHPSCTFCMIVTVKQIYPSSRFCMIASVKQKYIQLIMSVTTEQITTPFIQIFVNGY